MRNLDQVFSALRRSRFRQRFHLDEDERLYLHRQGLAKVLEHAKTFIQSRLAPATPRKDGRQTPWRGHPVFVAQHATGTCCRSCLEKWHRLPKGRPLEPTEVEYVLSMLEKWLRMEADHPASLTTTNDAAASANPELNEEYPLFPEP